MVDAVKEVLFREKGYPGNLNEVLGAPEKLFIRGEIKKEDARAVAIVGTRKMTPQGEKLAWDFSFYLAGKGVTIVSGLARGIDTTAHKAALAASGRTLAVLGSGVDVIYPKENMKLAETIIEKGALVSEFPSGTGPAAKNFLVRNRIISGLSKAVLVIEGAARSGTLSTATHAANQGREVFAHSGKRKQTMSAAPMKLIKEGATPVTSPEEILDYLASLT